MGTTNIAYDVQGNVSQRGAQAFIFDQANRLQSATGKASYRYDGLGRRTVINAADGSTSVQFYSSAGQILYSSITGGSSGAGSATRFYLGQRLIAETKTVNGASSTRYIHTDGLGSPVAHTDSAGTVVDRSRYEAYGANVNIADSTNPVGIGFTGHVNDVDTGLVYMQQRYYDPVAGRFLSTDQVLTDTASGASFNRYDYASNNPYRYTDPDGKLPQLGVAAAIAGTVLANALSGAAAAAVVNAGMQVLGPNPFQWSQVGEAAGEGAMIGTLFGAAGGIRAGMGGGALRGTVAVEAEVSVTSKASKAPDFIVSPGGTVFPVPKGATGPTPVINPSGNQTGVAYTGGSGGENGKVATMRIMNPTPAKGNSPGYPKGYVKYENAAVPKPQGVNPNSGKTLPNSESHFPIN